MNEPAVRSPQRDDVSPRAILAGGAAIAFAIVAVVLFAWFLLRHWGSDPNGPNSAREMSIAGPPLQTDARLDLQKYLQEKRQRLNSYGWSGDNPRRLHIPIERAMQLLAERTQAPVPKAPAAGSPAAGKEQP